MGIGVAGDIEPVLGKAFAEAGRGEQVVCRGGIGGFAALGCIGFEGRNLGGSGRQAGQVEGGSTQPGGGLGFGRRLEFLGLKFRQDIPIKGLTSPRGVAEFGRRGFLGRYERPMLLVGGALGDPAADEFDLRRRHLAVRFRRRHLVVRVMRQQALEDFALLWVSRHDCEAAVVFHQGFGADIQTELRLAVFRILAVAEETVLREDRTDVAVEAEVFGGKSRHQGEKQEDST